MQPDNNPPFSITKTKFNLIPIFLLGAALLALPAVVQAQFIYTTNNGTITNISLPSSLFSPAQQGFIRVSTQ